LSGLVSVRDSYTSEKLALLGEAFDNLAKCSNDGALPSLSLRVAFIWSNRQRDMPLRLSRDGLPHEGVWKFTVSTFNAAVRALASNKLRAKRLNIFNSPDLRMCSLGSD
jgi:hypothetical protein